ncbi:MAG TPA: glucokinase [Allosphingosinicella sp.]|nr:glucokinase [Allosphingosinicella sp.]
MEIVVADIGGTHARFAVASLDGCRVAGVSDSTTVRVADHEDFEAAWRAYAAISPYPLPRAASIAVAGPVDGDEVRLTNGAWVIRPASLEQELGIDRPLIINDFAAIAHAVAVLPDEHFKHVAGPGQELSDKRVISVIGPGTGLGAAMVVRHAAGYEIVPTEGGHIAFAPLDPAEDVMLDRLRKEYGRVSVERIVSASGLRAMTDGAPADTEALWKSALSGAHATALERYFLSLGSVAGDLALAQGAEAVVLAGGQGQRIADRLPASGFHDRFVAKGRFRRRMEAMPVKLVAHPEPGLYGAAAAFARAAESKGTR